MNIYQKELLINIEYLYNYSIRLKIRKANFIKKLEVKVKIRCFLLEHVNKILINIFRMPRNNKEILKWFKLKYFKSYKENKN